MLDVVKTFWIVLPGQVCEYPQVTCVAWCVCIASSMLVDAISWWLCGWLRRRVFDYCKRHPLSNQLLHEHLRDLEDVASVVHHAASSATTKDIIKCRARTSISSTAVISSSASAARVVSKHATQSSWDSEPHGLHETSNCTSRTNQWNNDGEKSLHRVSPEVLPQFSD
jgi:hypothetical protein